MYRLIGLRLLNRSQSYPVKYMIFAGTVITKVGDNPRHKEVTPSLRAIFRSPSNVELYDRFCVSSTAHSAPIAPILGAAMQYSTLFVAKKTSLQHAVTPRFGGSVLKDCGEDAASLEIVESGDGVEGCDCSRTRTTSRGVTVDN